MALTWCPHHSTKIQSFGLKYVASEWCIIVYMISMIQKTTKAGFQLNIATKIVSHLTVNVQICHHLFNNIFPSWSFHKRNNCERKATTTNPSKQLLIQTLYVKKTQAYKTTFFFFNNKGVQTSLSIPLSMYSPPIPHTLGNYNEESLGSGPKMLARDFKLIISWISWSLKNY